MKAPIRKVLYHAVVGAIALSVSSICWCNESSTASAPLACGGDFVPVLRAVRDLRREQAELARGTDTLALQIVEAKLRVAEAVQRFTFVRYAGIDSSDAIAAMREAVVTAEALPRGSAPELVATARSTLQAMLAAVGSTTEARLRGLQQ
jgi:hypothetical protein